MYRDVSKKNNKIVIVNREAKLHRYTNQSCLDAASIFNKFEKNIGCTYLIYMYENLNTNEKFVYSSEWGWQDLLIGSKLINHCPIFLTAFNYLEKRDHGHIFVPWHMAPPTNQKEREVCGLRSEFNIANGFGYGAKGHGARETLAFGGDSKDQGFYKHFVSDPNLFYNTLQLMRLTVLYKDHENKTTNNILANKQH